MSTFNLRLDGKVAIVTGAGSGIGRGIARGLGAAGATVCIADIDLPAAEETAGLIDRSGGRALASRVDVSDRASAEAVVAAAIHSFGRLDVLVNNAGTTNRDSLMGLSEAEFDRVIAVNLKGPLFCVQAAVPHLRTASSGSIINVVSTAAEIVSPRQAAYAASKGGLQSLTRVMAVELAADNIRANGIIPATTLTGMTRQRFADQAVLDSRIARIPLGRAGVPEDYAGAAILLASDASAWITGTMIWVDGGLHANA